ncbi:RusA family crossover junction endodeoxyribonuclease [Corynebacterium antarcticum]|uniref:hypothetical protein n=1 Tax=Corynebacterium antarcticum TaxID=2800405 RepID=UPI002B1F248D|nr:hypothetical protein [Corynebacterium antarcticum]
MNDRSHWATKARTTKKIREQVMWLARAAHLPRGVNHATVHLHYLPRDNRRRDTDNLIATLKPICDALATDHGLVPDDTPHYMAKPEPTIHTHQPGQQPAMWIQITTKETP